MNGGSLWFSILKSENKDCPKLKLKHEPPDEDIIDKRKEPQVDIDERRLRKDSKIQ